MVERCTTRTRLVSQSSSAMLEKVAPAATAPSSARALATSLALVAPANAVVKCQMPS